MTLDPPLDEMRRLGYRAIDLVVEHLAQLPSLPVAGRRTSAELDAIVREDLPRTGLGLEASLQRFFDVILPKATFVNHPRFFAYVPGPGSFAGALGEWVAAATNLFVGTWLAGASAARLELQTLAWLASAVGLDPSWSGILTSGGSMANLGALAAARARSQDATRAVVYLSAEAHYANGKAAHVLGFPRAQIRVVGVDAALRMDVAALRAAIAADRAGGLLPCAIVATAGTTNTGAIDPLTAIADVAADAGAWLHVDGAYGAAMTLLPEHRASFAGLERADSVTIDPHKWLYAPFECGALLVRDLAALHAAFAADGAIMQDIPREEVNFFERGPELTRGNRALKLWLLLRAVGLDAIAAAIRDDVRRCQLACDALRTDPRVRIVTEPQLSVFTFAVGDEARGQRLFERVLADGFLMLSSSRVRGEFVLRFCVVNHRTTDDDVLRSVARIRALID